jgi:hypothetical protein
MKALGLSEFFLVATEVTDFCRSRGIVASGGAAPRRVSCATSWASPAPTR